MSIFRGMFKKIQGKVREDSWECSGGFRGMSGKILANVQKDPGNAQEDSKDCSRRFRGMFQKISRNAFNFRLMKATFYLKYSKR